MWKLIFKISILILLVCGFTQCFLVTGLVWNYGFPLAPFIILFISYISFKDKFNNEAFIRKGSILLLLLVLFECGFILYSNMQISSTKVDTEIKILSYNVFFKNGDKQQSVFQIKQANPDILLIQECTPEWESILGKQLAKDYPYKSVKSLNGTNGIAVYSKFSIEKTNYLTYPNGVPYTQIVDLNVKGKKIQILNTHLASPAIAVENSDRFLSYYIENYKTRKNQIKTLNQLSNNKAFSCQLIVGDLNTIASEPIFKRLKSRWVNANRTPFWWKKLNFPNSSRIRPILTLDYIMARGNVKFIESSVIQGGSSDHLPIYTRVKI